MDNLRSIGENLPAPPRLVVTSSSSSTSKTTSATPSAALCGIDPELQLLLDSDPGLRDLMRKSRSFQPHQHRQDEYGGGGGGWHSLPSGGGGGGDGMIVAAPNVVQSVRAQAVVPVRSD